MMIPHRGGLPHSDTSGSTPARGFPKIFAACHVLLRLLAPRHPPDALLILNPIRPRPSLIQAPRTGTIHPIPQTPDKPSRPKQQGSKHPYHRIHTHTHTSPLNTAPASRSDHRQKPAAEPGQTPTQADADTPKASRKARHAKPRTAPPETPELSCASRDATEPDSQYIMNTPQPHLAVVGPRSAKRRLRGTPNNRVRPRDHHPHARSCHHTHTHTRGHTHALETIGIEPMTPCLQSRCSPS